MKNIDDYTIGELKELIAKKEKKDWKKQSLGQYRILLCDDGIYRYSRHKHTYNFSYTKESDAELFAKKMDLMNRMNLFALIHNEGWKADWEGARQKKWGIGHNEDSCFIIEEHNDYNMFLFGISVKSEEIAESMLEEFKDELNIYLE